VRFVTTEVFNSVAYNFPNICQTWVRSVTKWTMTRSFFFFCQLNPSLELTDLWAQKNRGHTIALCLTYPKPHCLRSSKNSGPCDIGNVKNKQWNSLNKWLILLYLCLDWDPFFFFLCVWKNHTLRCFQSMNAHKLKLNLTVNRTWILGKFLKVGVNYRKCGKNKQRNNNEIHWINDWFYYIYALIEIFLR